MTRVLTFCNALRSGFSCTDAADVPRFATSYVYDANGRVIAVSNDAGEAARYVYDVMGNIKRIDRLAGNELALFAFTPGRGVSGTKVSLQGHGVAAEPSANTVQFAGTPARHRKPVPRPARLAPAATPAARGQASRQRGELRICLLRSGREQGRGFLDQQGQLARRHSTGRREVDRLWRRESLCHGNPYGRTWCGYGLFRAHQWDHNRDCLHRK